MIRLLLTGLFASAALAARAADSAAGVEFFEKRIRPLLVDRCYECHSADAKKLKGGLYLDSSPGRKSVLKTRIGAAFGQNPGLKPPVTFRET